MTALDISDPTKLQRRDGKPILWGPHTVLSPQGLNLWYAYPGEGVEWVCCVGGDGIATPGKTSDSDLIQAPTYAWCEVYERDDGELYVGPWDDKGDYQTEGHIGHFRREVGSDAEPEWIPRDSE
jgi:hypothetical protein